MAEAALGILGLAFSACSMLELGVKSTSATMTLVHGLRTVDEDFVACNHWLDTHLETLRKWMALWGLENAAASAAAEERPIHLWGADGKRHMERTLGMLKQSATAAQALVDQYRAEMSSASPRQRLRGVLGRVRRGNPHQPAPAIPSGPAPLVGQQTPSNTAQHTPRLTGKARFIFSGKAQLERNLDEIQKCLKSLLDDSEMFFLGAHPEISRGQISVRQINTAVLETITADTAYTVRKASQSLYDTLEVGQKAFDIELALSDSRFDKGGGKALVKDDPFLDHTLKFPLLVGHSSGQPSKDCWCAYVAEVDTAAQPSGTPQGKAFQSLLEDCKSICSCQQLPPLGHSNYRHILHRCPLLPAALTTTTASDVSAHSLRTLLEELATCDYRSIVGKFPMKRRLQLSYVLALSVLQIQSGWLQKLDSGNVLQRGTEGFGVSIRLRRQDPSNLAPRVPPVLESYCPAERREVFQLGILLFEVGMGQVGIDDEMDVDDLLDQIHSSMVPPTYARVVEVCVQGDLHNEPDERRYLDRLSAEVVEPLKSLLEPGAYMRGRRMKGKKK